MSPPIVVRSSTLACAATPAPGIDPQTAMAGLVYAWTVNDAIVVGANSATLSGAFVKGDRVRCSVAQGENSLLSAFVPSAEAIVFNESPPAVTAVTLSPSTFSRSDALLTCTHSVSVDPDGDAVSYEYLWQKGGTDIGAWGPAATLGNASFVGGDSLRCAVRAGDGTALSAGTWSASRIADNVAPTGTITCSSPSVFGRTGAAFAFTCSGASDLDGASTLAYQFEARSGTCPTLAPGTGAFSGAIAAAGTCVFRVKACDDTGACTAQSVDHAIVGYDASLALAAPTLDASCQLSFAGTPTLSSNISSPTYDGTCGVGMLATSAGATGISATLPSGTAAGAYTASWGITAANVTDSASTAVTASTTRSFSLTSNATPPLVARTPAATLAGYTHEGLQAPFATPSGGCQTCDANTSAMISAGQTTTCALSGTTLKCWGAGTARQLGNGGTSDTAAPVNVSVVSTAKAVGVGAIQACALLANGTVTCWGQNSSFATGQSTAAGSSDPGTSVQGVSGAVSLSVGSSHACVVVSTGGVRCWGEAYYGNLGNNTSGVAYNSGTGVTPTGLGTGVKAVFAGANHNCAILAGGISCWGKNNVGQVGNSGTTNVLVPTAVAQVTDTIVQMALGDSHSCALTTAGAVLCWGGGTAGQLGHGTAANSNTTVTPTGLTSNVVSLAAGGDSTCALKNDGSVWCWGSNSAGQLGDGTFVQRNAPTAVAAVGSLAVAVSVGTTHSCALLRDGESLCWGDRAVGQTGSGTMGGVNRTVAAVPGLVSAATSIVAGNQNACAKTAAGYRCWGLASSGQLGAVMSGDTGVAQLVPSSVAGATLLRTRANRSCAIVSGALWCWGDNANGALGTGSFSYADNEVPRVAANLPGTVTDVAMHTYVTCALKSDGTVSCAGTGNKFMGQGNTYPNSHSFVTTIGGGATRIAAITDHMCAVVSGAVKCWGLYHNPSVPTDVAGFTSGVVDLVGGHNHLCAIMSDTSVKCFGDNTVGQMGTGTSGGGSFFNVTVTGVPVVSGVPLSGVVALAAGNHHTCALFSGGGLRCWGYNISSQIGDGTTSTAVNPTIPTNLPSDALAIAAGDAFTCALRPSGAVECLGSNSVNQLGRGSPGNPATVIATQGLPAALVSLVKSCVDLALAP